MMTRARGGASSTASMDLDNAASKKIMGASVDEMGFFDFDLHDDGNTASTDGPGKLANAEPTIETLPGWGSDLHVNPPLSPPLTGADVKEWPFPMTGPASATPANVLKAMQNYPYQAPYGQVTPPEDQQDDIFRHNTQHIPQEQQQQLLDFDQDTSPTTTTAITNNNTGTGRKRRNRRYAGLSARSAKEESGNPTDAKRSKFLERNRVAASKCRQKKKEWTQGLESKARELQKDNATLHLMLGSLREEVMWLKGQFKLHETCEMPANNTDLDTTLALAAQQAMSHAFSNPGSGLNSRKEVLGAAGSISRHSSSDDSTTLSSKLQESTDNEDAHSRRDHSATPLTSPAESFLDYTGDSMDLDLQLGTAEGGAKAKPDTDADGSDKALETLLTDTLKQES